MHIYRLVNLAIIPILLYVCCSQNQSNVDQGYYYIDDDYLNKQKANDENQQTEDDTSEKIDDWGYYLEDTTKTKQSEQTVEKVPEKTAELIQPPSLPEVQKKPPEPEKKTASQVETGKASYYGSVFHGRPTASGEIYDKNKLTAAHRTLPFGTTVRVTNLSNGKIVDVKVNDRGPHVKSRIIDLSYRAMNELDGISAGIINVKVEVFE